MTEKSNEPEGTDQPTGEFETCKVCGELLGPHPEQHLWTTHLMSLGEYEGWEPSRPRQRILEIGKFERIPPPPLPPPPPPEPVIEVKLADLDTNPDRESVQGRRGTSYLVSKREWTPIRAPDVWRIVGTEGIPSRYPYLTFEMREPNEEQEKKTKK